jgi:hypothetical protein
LQRGAKFDRKIVISEKKNKAREIERAVLGNDDPKASIARNQFPVRSSRLRREASGGRLRVGIPAGIAKAEMKTV